MATSSILGGSQVPEEISGKDMHALGPSDNSDSGSDAIGAYGEDELASDSDSAGTGERAEAGMGGIHSDADILPDHIEQGPGVQAEADETASSELNDLSEVEELADDSEDQEAQDSEAGDEEAGPPRKT
jgi:hypothetical protein